MPDGLSDDEKFKYQMKRQWDIQRRVMGKALSTARPGEPFDILLGHYLI